MKRFRSETVWRRVSLGLLLLVIAFGTARPPRAIGADTKAAESKDTGGKAAETPKEDAAEKKPAKKLSGAELYAIHCNRCHPERYATEWTPPQWKTIMLHMRVRANLPAAQAKAILKFLQEESGN